MKTGAPADHPLRGRAAGAPRRRAAGSSRWTAGQARGAGARAPATLCSRGFARGQSAGGRL